MQKSHTVKTGWYIFSDVIASATAWIILTHKRKIWLNEEPLTYKALFTGYDFLYSSLVLALIFWITLFAVSGSYNQALYKRSQLKEITASIIQCLIGSILLLFILFLNDRESNPAYLYDVFFYVHCFANLVCDYGQIDIDLHCIQRHKKEPATVQYNYHRQ